MKYLIRRTPKMPSKSGPREMYWAPLALLPMTDYPGSWGTLEQATYFAFESTAQGLVDRMRSDVGTDKVEVIPDPMPWSDRWAAHVRHVEQPRFDSERPLFPQNTPPEDLRFRRS